MDLSMKLRILKAKWLIFFIDKYLTRGFIKEIYRLVAPRLFVFYFTYIKNKTKANTKKILSEIGREDRIPIFLIATHPSQWVADDLYKLLAQSNRFEAFVVIPYYQGVYDCNQEKLRNYYHQLGYKVCEPRVVHKESKKQPIILVYFQYILSGRGSRPLNNCLDINLFKNSLKLFLSYGIPVDENPRLLHGRLFNAYTDYQFVFSKDVIEQAESYKAGLSENFLVTGYLGCDGLINKSKINNQTKSGEQKRVIWAPHHSIDSRAEFPFSTFTIHSNDFLDFFKCNKDKFDLLFKPHPHLRSALYNSPDWGRQRTDDYFLEFEKKFRSSYGAYEDDFIWSDCILMDSISFLASYSTQCKPICFLMSRTNKLSNFSKLGRRFLSGAYIATNFKDIECFLQDVVIGNSDPLKETRLKLFDEFFAQYKQISSAKRSYEKILKITSQ
jgi:hypothetical protein